MDSVCSFFVLRPSGNRCVALSENVDRGSRIKSAASFGFSGQGPLGPTYRVELQFGSGPLCSLRSPSLTAPRCAAVGGHGRDGVSRPDSAETSHGAMAHYMTIGRKHEDAASSP